MMLGPGFMTIIFGFFSFNIPATVIVFIPAILFTIIISCLNASRELCFGGVKVACVFLSMFILNIFYTIETVDLNLSQKQFILSLYLIYIPIIIISTLNFRYIVLNERLFLNSFKKMAVYVIIISSVAYLTGTTWLRGRSVIPLGFDNQIWFSRFICDALIVVIFHLFKFKKNIVSSISLILIGVSMLYFSSSRAPVISMVLVIILFLYFNNKSLFKGFMIFMVPVLFIFSVPIYNLIYNVNPYSIMERLTLYEEAITLIEANSLGYGISSFSYFNPKFQYPHNIFLEVTIDMGVFGLLVYGLLIFITIVQSRKDNVFYYLFFMALINALSSGNLTGNNYLFLYSFISLVYTYKYTFFKVQKNVE